MNFSAFVITLRINTDYFPEQQLTILCFRDTLHCQVEVSFLYKIRKDFSFRPVL